MEEKGSVLTDRTGSGTVGTGKGSRYFLRDLAPAMEKGLRDYRDYTKYIICKTDISHLNVHESEF